VKRVLVVDDEPMIRQLVADFLAEAGYQIDTAANGSEALHVMARQKPDAVVLDLMMPKLDATGFVELMRLNPRYARLPIVVMTAAFNAAEEAARLGAQACVTKPFELEELVDTVAHWIGRPERPPLQVNSGVIAGDTLSSTPEALFPNRLPRQ
jgi:two-component system, OmpR family, response regulator